MISPCRAFCCWRRAGGGRRATADGSQHVAATAQQPSNRIESSNRRHARPAAPAADSSANTKPGATLTWVPLACSVLSLDVGRRRIGLAGCDPLGITVRPLPALHRGRFDADLAVLRDHCRSRGVVGLVVGLPLDSEGLADATGGPLPSLRPCASPRPSTCPWPGSMNTAAVGPQANATVWPVIAADAWTALQRRCSWSSGFRRGRISNRSTTRGVSRASTAAMHGSLAHPPTDHA